MTVLAAGPGRRAAGVEVIAHRGAMNLAPENTLAAQRLAYELGAEIVEVDVRSSRDGVPVILHDHYLERTTNGTGLVLGLTLQEIRALDAGSWFGPQFAGERVPTLADVLAVARQYNGRVLLDIKDGQIADRVNAVIRESGLPAERILFLTYWDEMTAPYVTAWPGVRMLRTPASAATGAAIRPEHITPGDLEFMRRQKVTTLHFGVAGVSQEEAQRFHAAGFEVSCIYQPPTTAFVFDDNGVDYFWTDYPDVTIASHRRTAHQWMNWADGAGLAPDQQRSTADPDSDGVPNLVEYARGTDPLHRNPPADPAEELAGRGPWPEAAVSGATAQWNLTLRENWSQFLTVRAQADDGGGWTNLPGTCCAAPAPDRLRFTLPLARGQRFFRLQFDLAAPHAPP